MKIPNKLLRLWKHLRRTWKNTSLGDRFLLIFMVLLLGQAAHNLLFHELAAGESSTVDVVFRTTAASIFGYFIGGAFRKDGDVGAQQNLGEEIPSSPTVSSQTPQARIGFSAETSSRVETQGRIEVSHLPPGRNDQGKRGQIVIVSLIGLFSLSLLLLAHGTGEMPSAALATISQLRDFVSGSVGLLIGASKQSSA